MARTSRRYVCQSCGAVYGRWAGRCESCAQWNSLVEEAGGDAPPLGGKGRGKAAGRVGTLHFHALEGTEQAPPRLITGIGEFDRVLGGGLTPGSSTLIGGDPGIGKSTLLLQVTAALSAEADCVYISGEEAVDQVRLRAARLGVAGTPVRLAAATGVRDILSALDAPDAPAVAVVDSIQTMYVDALESAPGTVGQVRASAQELIRVGKRRGIALLLVGHVTKDGAIAGPRVLEHMVDAVLYFEGERGHAFRILRGVKNRYGPTDEIGVFDMTARGLSEVKNPSALFLSERDENIPGAVVFAGIEGTRPMLSEIQALAAPSQFSAPRRAAVGWDANRLSMILAVLETRAGLDLSGRDIYLNVAGGLRIAEPAADLAVAAAIMSSHCGAAVPGDAVVFGEIGLSGEVRGVSQSAARLKEAAKLGFTQAMLPKFRRREGGGATPQDGGRERYNGLNISEFSDLGELLAMISG